MALDIKTIVNHFSSREKINWLRICKTFCILNMVIIFLGLFGEWLWFLDNLRNFIFQQLPVAALFCLILSFDSFVWLASASAAFIVGFLSLGIINSKESGETIPAQSDKIHTILSFNVGLLKKSLILKFSKIWPRI